MTYASMDEIAQEVKQWEFILQLPEEIAGFHKVIDGTKEGKLLTIGSYVNESLHAKVDIVYTSETFDYILIRTRGLNTYRDVRFVYKERDIFAQEVEKALPSILAEMSHPEKVNLGEMVANKGILTWEYGSNLPTTMGDFNLYIKPSAAMEYINGSIIFIDYSNMEHKNQLLIFYNRLRDEFFGEVKIKGVFHATKDFDSKTLGELKQKLEGNLKKTLQAISAKEPVL